DRDDVRDANRARAAKSEGTPTLPFQSDHIRVPLSVDLNAAGKKFIADEIFVRAGPSTPVVRPASGSAKIHKRFHMIVGDFRPAQHAVIGGGLGQAHN